MDKLRIVHGPDDRVGRFLATKGKTLASRARTLGV